MKRESQQSAVGRFCTAVIAGLAIFVVACGGGQSNQPAAATGEVTLGYAGGPNIEKYFNQILPGVPQGITVKKVVYATYDDQLNQMPQQVAAGTIPDVIVWDNSAPVAQYSGNKAIRSLDDLVSSNSMDLGVYPKALVKAWTIDGKLYGIPSYLQNSAFVYNQDLLQQAGVASTPQSMDDVRQAAKSVKSKTGKAGLVILDNLFHLTQYELAFGGGWNYGKTINSPENAAGLQFLVDMFTKDKAAVTPNQVGATWDGDALSKNLAAMSDGGPWYIGFMQATAPNVKYSLQPIPSSTAGTSFVVTYGGAYSITSHAKNPAAGMRLVKYLTNSDSEHAIITSGLGFVPAWSKYLGEYTSATPQYAAFTQTVLSNGRTLDYPAQTTQFGNDLVKGFEDIVFRNSGTVRDLLNSLQSKYGH